MTTLSGRADSFRAAGGAAASVHLAPGSVLRGRYEIQQEIGCGSHSVVYLARDRELDARVAIKVVVPPPAVAVLVRERLRREVQALHGLLHANMVAVHDLLEEGPRSLVIMEYVDGPDLGARLYERGPLDAPQATALSLDIATALSAAHRRGILHRGLKPQNILLDRDGRARLSDFGATRLAGQATPAQAGELAGTLAFAAPEVLAGQRADARGDLYALGLTLYVALVGHLPGGVGPQQPLPPRPDGYHPRMARDAVPEWLDALVARLTAAEPAHRLPTAASLADALVRGPEDPGESVMAEPDHHDHCLLCGAPDSLGSGVCPACGGSSESEADTLIFVQRTVDAAERERTTSALLGLLGAPRESADILPVARGHRALVRVPAAAVERVLDRLARRQVAANAAHQSTAWAPLPGALYGLLAGVMAAGLIAGEVAAPALLWATPLVTGALLAAAQFRLRQPLIRPRRVAGHLPPFAEQKVMQAFAMLAPGTAQALLADIARQARALYSVLPAGGHGGLDAEVVRVVSSACDAALDLADLDASLTGLERQRVRYTGLSSRWLDGFAQCERARDWLVQHLLEVLTVLSRARAQAAGSPAEAAGRLGELTEEMEIEVRAQARTAHAVEELLSRSA